MRRPARTRRDWRTASHERCGAVRSRAGGCHGIHRPHSHRAGLAMPLRLCCDPMPKYGPARWRSAAGRRPSESLPDRRAARRENRLPRNPRIRGESPPLPSPRPLRIQPSIRHPPCVRLYSLRQSVQSPIAVLTQNHLRKCSRRSSFRPRRVPTSGAVRQTDHLADTAAHLV